MPSLRILPPPLVVEYENLTKRAIDKLILDKWGFGDKYLVAYSSLESVDGWRIGLSGSGSVRVGADGAVLKTGTTLGSDAHIARDRYAKAYGKPFSGTNWDKNPRVLFWFHLATDTYQEAFVGIGRIPYKIPNGVCMGFKIVNDKVYGCVADGVAESTVELWTITLWESHKWEARLTSGVKCEFWMDGVKKAEITTNLPSGKNDLGFWFGIKNTAAEDKKLFIITAIKIEDM